MQLMWSGLPVGDVILRVGDSESPAIRGGAGLAGATVLHDLEPDTRYDVSMEVGSRRSTVTRFRTLRPPPGELLSRFATISDLHIGERAFGVLPRLREDPDRTTDGSYPARCARAALAEAVAWGAEHVVAKGDLTWSGRPLQWKATGEVLATSPVPVSATLGNHDVVPKAVDGREQLAAYGIIVPRRVEAVDLVGLRIVIGHSADRGHRYGVIDGVQSDEIVRLAGEGPGPAFFTMHHYIDPLPVRSRFPRGVSRAQGGTLLRELAASNPSTFISFGHTHRNRRRREYGLPVTEVGSTKDYPGVWAGYAVYEGGIRQVVRRVAAPECLEWTEQTAAAFGGAWGRFSPGRLGWRCFSWTWPSNPGRTARRGRRTPAP